MKRATQKSTDANKQRAYRKRQKESGVPTANVVAMATFRFIMSDTSPRKKKLRDRIADQVNDYLIRRHPELTSRGVEYRFYEMIEEANRIRALGWFDSDMGNGDTELSNGDTDES
ncbi:hypothetical protein [Oryzibacter oryziterrae]|uniref:hypothetical protein n=1 Tax=Oryzibacter oryziterrae TaxID=2766474 RepID=UPI001F37E23E|nr:hypothetical protein [Oryzibacter oryziterrae]